MTKPFLQHYYTSYRNEATGHNGFGTKARSVGFTPELEHALFPLIDYTYSSIASTTRY